eukprot:9470512-Pyramimonas_sp.AAC.1
MAPQRPQEALRSHPRGTQGAPKKRTRKHPRGPESTQENPRGIPNQGRPKMARGFCRERQRTLPGASQNSQGG